ncbi:thiamine phosphate synthase [uncultured Microscilla sp.]|uniref:thiamine phosphate synthase n=1 Tax=uncultured Microscilla sp. TaxID=432653 RepID=UPI00261D0AAD|nr:thiamine phosphate synthase [uncultured Microscilla sp.]
MKKEIAKLQYITQQTNTLSHVQAAQKACEAGCNWVQLRVKDTPEAEVQAIALKVKAICALYGATFILNDHVAVAKAVHADGVHLGKEDMSPKEARKILGKDAIIGGTANTFEDVQRLVKARVDYIGAGPFRFTTTKKKLSPVLGAQGYTTLMANCYEQNIDTPIVAIGGIVAEDLSIIRQTGVYGVAVSGVITHHQSPAQVVETMQTTFNISRV